LRKRSRPIEPMILAAANTYNVDPNLLWTIAYLESRFNEQATSYKEGRPCALGLMQFTPSTAQRYGLKNPYDAAEAVEAAAQYVRDLLVRFDGRVDLVLAAYNAGEGTVEAYRIGKRLVLKDGKVVNPNALRTGGVPPYSETQSYIAHARLVYDTIRTQQLFTSPLKASSPKLELVRKNRNAESSLYPSDSAAGADEKVSKFKEGVRTLSLYPN
jgi:soluble lytic murein transglycosylase-like protein